MRLPGLCCHKVATVERAIRVLINLSSKSRCKRNDVVELSFHNENMFIGLAKR